MTNEKLEVMIVDDDESWLRHLKCSIGKKGYDIVTAQGTMPAIEQIAIRLHESKNLPEIYVCDMLDTSLDIAILNVNDMDKLIHPAIAFTIHNYLRTKNISPEYFITMSAVRSREDSRIIDQLKIPFFLKENYERIEECFPDVNGLDKTLALEKFAKEYHERFDYLRI